MKKYLSLIAVLVFPFTFLSAEITRTTRKVLVSNKKLTQGSIVRKEDIDIKRAGCGISPYELDVVVNHKLIKDIDGDDPLTWEHFLR